MCALGLAAIGGAQGQLEDRPQEEGRRAWDLNYGGIQTKVDGDFTYWLVTDLDFKSGDMRVRSNRAVLVFDTDEVPTLDRPRRKNERLPRREAIAPVSQRDILARRLRRRLESRSEALANTAGSSRAEPTVPPGKGRLALLVRALFAQGDVVFEQGGIHNLRCRKLFLSLVSDRGTMEDVEVRLPVGTPYAPEKSSFVMRCPLLLQQGNRLVARNARLSTCEAGEAHFAMHSDRLTVVLRPEVTEFLGQGNTLEFQGLPGLPLPDYRYYSDQENWIPLKSVSVGVSDDRGEFALATLGGRWNDVGQSIVNLFGAPAQPFRGEWWLRSGHTRRRGIPVEGGLSYAVPGVFNGNFETFFLRDLANDRRSVQKLLDGTPIDAERRVFVRSSNRIPVDANTRVDIQAFWAGDPAAYSEFRDLVLKSSEQPETIVHVRHAKENRRISAIGRVNIANFAYNELATLTEKFRSERPYVRADLFAQPLFEVVEDMPVVLTASLGGGRLRNQFDRYAANARTEASWRADLELDLSLPTSFGFFALQPFFTLRQTYYSDRPGDTGADWRTAFETGALVSTRLARSYDFDNEALGIRGLYHEMRPEVRAFHRFRVDGSPTDYFQFDPIDALDELSAVDFTLLNRLQTRRKSPTGDSYADDVVFLDLVQRVFPNASRDNGGDHLGLFAWELIVRPGRGALPVPNLRFLFEGERDWNQDDFRTRNIGIAAGPNELNAAAEWRSGRDGDGEGSFYVQTQMFGRWTATAGLIYDFRRDDLTSTYLNLQRRDHDWTWVVALSRNENTNDTNFTFRFVPTFGGLLQPYRARYIGGDPAFGVRNSNRF